MSRSDNQKHIDDLSHCLAPAVVTNAGALMVCARTAAWLGNPSSTAEHVITMLGEGSVSEYETTVPINDPSGVVLIEEDYNSNVTNPSDYMLRVGISAARENVREIVDSVDGFVNRAMSLGFSTPSNPFAEIIRLREQMAWGTPYINVSAEKADDMVYNISVFLKLLAAERAGTIELNGLTMTGGAQLSHVGFSTDGYVDFYSDSSDVDLANYLVDVDQAKRDAIGDILTANGFSKRIPKITFTMKYDPDGQDRGAIVAWKRMYDASGYYLYRHDLFENVEKKFTFTNSKLLQTYPSLKPYIKEWALAFYSSLGEDDIFAFLDEDVKQDKMYTYTIAGYQKSGGSSESIFDIDSAASMISEFKLREIESELLNTAKFRFGLSANVTSDDVSPYPIISKKIYGDEKFDWVLAGVNVLLAARRSESRNTVRNFSYIGSKFSFIRQEITAGRFYVPKNPGDVAAKLMRSIVSYGVSKTLLEVLDKTGMLFYFGSKELMIDQQFVRAGQSTGVNMQQLDAIFSSIDPSSATFDIGLLTSNLVNTITAIMGTINATGLDETVTPTEITVNQAQEEFAEDFLQFINVSSAGSEIIDITTFEGMREFIRILREFFDFGITRADIISRRGS